MIVLFILKRFQTMYFRLYQDPKRRTSIKPTPRYPPKSKTANAKQHLLLYKKKQVKKVAIEILDVQESSLFTELKNDFPLLKRIKILNTDRNILEHIPIIAMLKEFKSIKQRSLKFDLDLYTITTQPFSGFQRIKSILKSKIAFPHRVSNLKIPLADFHPMFTFDQIVHLVKYLKPTRLYLLNLYQEVQSCCLRLGVYPIIAALNSNYKHIRIDDDTISLLAMYRFLLSPKLKSIKCQVDLTPIITLYKPKDQEKKKISVASPTMDYDSLNLDELRFDLVTKDLWDKTRKVLSDKTTLEYLFVHDGHCGILHNDGNEISFPSKYFKAFANDFIQMFGNNKSIKYLHGL
ncbi:hypothetical protein CYY_002441 [Polysphondylium violaceum]|uniref:Uncharacterized protein n=1 Tax=Polysphondylium violaceum TaxID=133409 RepID=A0A8J4PWH6_9MYCE|nr:hypothetical protein CYY_002441 [Polysphondylium violaceum]